MHDFYSGLGRFSVRFRWFIVVFWLAATILAGHFFPSLMSVTKQNNTDFLPKNSPTNVATHLGSPLQNANLTSVPVVVSRPGQKLTAADLPYIARLTSALAEVPHVKRARDLGPSPDGMATQIQTLANINLGQDGPIRGLVDGLRSAIAGVPAPPGVHTHLAGQAADQVDTERKSGNTGAQVQLLSVFFILALLILIFRSPLAPIITLAPAFIVTELSGRIVAQLTNYGLQVSGLCQILLIILVLGAGTDYGLFLIFRVREEIRAGLRPHDAIARSVERVGESITFSGGTVIAALLCLLFASFGAYSSLGPPLAIAIFTMLVAGLTLTPALLAIFGRAVFWPVKLVAEANPKTPLWGRIAARVVARPVATLTAGTLVFGALALVVFAYTPAGFGNAVGAPKGTDAYAGDAVLAAHFPKAAANPTNVIFRFDQPVWNSPATLDKAQQLLSGSAGLQGVTGPTNPNGSPLSGATYAQLHEAASRVVANGDPRGLPPREPTGVRMSPQAYALYRAEANYVSTDGQTVQYLVSLQAGDPSTPNAMRVVPVVRNDARSVAAAIGAAQWAVGGQAPALYDISSTSSRDLRTVIPIAVFVIGLLLAIVMRSLVAPVYLIVSVVLSYLAALGLCVLLFEEIGGTDGLTFLLPFLMFVFLLALGEDYNILVMTRIREEAHHVPLREAVRRAVGVTGSTVTSAGLVLAGTFAVVAVVGARQPGGEQFRDLGAGLAIGVLMDTFLVRSLLVPSTVALLGKWNWWPSKLHELDHADDQGDDEDTDRVDDRDDGIVPLAAPAAD
jgi:RND superfamily putative drug exporter